MSQTNETLPFEAEVKRALEASVDADVPAGNITFSAIKAGKGNVIEIGNLSELRQVARTYLYLSPKITTRGIENLLRELRHEGEHVGAAEAMGATATCGMVLFKGGEIFNLFMRPVGELTHDQDLIITARPSRLSDGDKYKLEQSGSTVRDVDEIARLNDWPRPLSLRRWLRRS